MRALLAAGLSDASGFAPLGRRRPFDPSEEPAMSASPRKLVLFGVAAAVLGAATSQAFAWDTSPLGHRIVKQHHLCGTNDLPEGRLQGDVPMKDQKSGRAQKGYNCGL